MHEQGQIEAKILAKLNKSNSPFIVRAYDFFIFRSHICITYEILGKNLYEISQANNYRPLPVKLVRQYATEMLRGIEQCHRLGIVHCDLKPENVLVCPDNKVHCKLIDFGSSCFDGHQKYEYIQSRFYRAPEVMIGVKYGPPMDIWSFALIVVELLLGKPLFPGENELEQLTMIAEVLGNPNAGLVRQGKRKNEFFDEQLHLKQSRSVRKRIPGSLPLSRALKSNDPVYEDFIARCLTWDPIARTTATQLLQHPWLHMKEVKKAPKQQSMLPDLHPQDN
ncbi:CMGC family protein kinase [Trichomonas vaginalis G3]|uniref:CMGC family protein kinase n=1 Tax=Trichomonas vaginalis (strain ATCC PRA-98 / G3) TaxID=412133 RepID=A2DLC2_TRIV3|nr:protein kinase protein [Trichomonas vaginalis G3]EAY18740.1 CMGC family protein kinase [Trichomonas vaginalis G3]KAI5539323.1 protein kinase protein [Trichomonas vaginalis G3]|eukprot:XP_001579726.1 CMGC family protein kinase [Trichomonas vaginalis G3]